MRGTRILLVEAEAGAQAALAEYCRGFGCRLVAVPDMPSALALLRSGPSFDLVVVDLTPDSGERAHGFIEAVKAIDREVEMLFTSGLSAALADHGQDGAALRDGAGELPELLRLIEQLAAGHPPPAGGGADG